MAAICGSGGLAQEAKVAPAAKPVVHAVYLLPMANGFDQLLANRLAHDGVVRVVADPNKADALLTDSLGAGFEARIRTLYPDLKVADEDKLADLDVARELKRIAREEKLAKAQAESKTEHDTSSQQGGMNVHTSADGGATAASRGRGTVFLVQRGSWEVLWSGYRTPNKRQPKDLQRAAASMASSLKKHLQVASPIEPDGK